MALTRKVNGVEVPIAPNEEADIRAAWLNNKRRDDDAASEALLRRNKVSSQDLWIRAIARYAVDAHGHSDAQMEADLMRIYNKLASGAP